MAQVNLVSFSGGRTSAYMVWLMEQKRKEEGWNVSYVFMDTGAEHPATYQFIRDIVKHWGINLTCLRVKYGPQLGIGNGYTVVDASEIGPDLGPWEGMVTKYGLPSVTLPYCTLRMKTEPFEKFAKEVYGKGNYTTWIGIRADEPNRLKPKDHIRYLAEISDFDKTDVLDWWEDQGFDLQILEHLGNCVFCVKKSPLKIALAERDEPKLYKEFVSLVEGPTVRMEGRKIQTRVMYRKRATLSGIKDLYSQFPRKEIYGRLQFTKRLDTGSCTESCEVFNVEEEELGVSRGTDDKQ